MTVAVLTQGRAAMDTVFTDQFGGKVGTHGWPREERGFGLKPISLMPFFVSQRNPCHFFPEQQGMRRLHPQEFVPNVVFVWEHVPRGF